MGIKQATLYIIYFKILFSSGVWASAALSSHWYHNT
jgi:hypothetical protein